MLICGGGGGGGSRARGEGDVVDWHNTHLYSILYNSKIAIIQE